MLQYKICELRFLFIIYCSPINTIDVRIRLVKQCINNGSSIAEITSGYHIFETFKIAHALEATRSTTDEVKKPNNYLKTTRTHKIGLISCNVGNRDVNSTNINNNTQVWLRTRSYLGLQMWRNRPHQQCADPMRTQTRSSNPRIKVLLRLRKLETDGT